MNFRKLQPASILRGAFIALLLIGSVLFCKPQEEETDLAFWAVVAWARASGLTKPGSVNQCVDEANCPNQTEGDFTASSSTFSSAGLAGSCNISSVSLCINLPAFGKAAQFCERSDGELSLEKCAASQDKLPAVGTCVFQRGQAVFYKPLYSSANGPELCKRVYKGKYTEGYEG